MRWARGLGAPRLASALFATNVKPRPGAATAANSVPSAEGDRGQPDCWDCSGLAGRVQRSQNLTDQGTDTRSRPPGFLDAGTLGTRLCRLTVTTRRGDETTREGQAAPADAKVRYCTRPRAPRWRDPNKPGASSSVLLTLVLWAGPPTWLP